MLFKLPTGGNRLRLFRPFLPFTIYIYLTISDMVPDMLRKPPQAPPVFIGTPTSIVDDTRRLIERSRKVQNQVAEDVRPDTATFANVLVPLAHAENAMAVEAHILGFYKVVSPDSRLRDASSVAQKLLDNFAIETAMREDLYKLVDAVLKKNEDLDQESYQLLVKKHKDYIRNGLRLPVGPKRDRFKEIKRRLSQLTLDFQQNVVEENGGIWFLPQELEGVSKDVLSGLKKGEGENKGKLRLTFNYPDFYPAMKYAKNGETRKRILIANDNKCNQNVPLFKEVMVLRDEAARLLGYPNHAAFRLEDKMAKTPKTVDTFLGDLRSRLTTGGAREVEKLKQLKEADLAFRGELFDGQFLSWDLSFYNRLMLETQYLVDQEKIAEYFPLQTTIKGMLEIFQHLFGLVFLEITNDENKLANSGIGSDLIWHEDVQVFSVWNDNEQGSGFVGYLYLDLFPRDGKYGHAANFNLWPVYRTLYFLWI
jgi:metallopeptidase MepB